MTRIFHYCPSIARHDAIGYSVTFLHGAMLKAGLPSFLVCDSGVVASAPPGTMTFEELVASKPRRDDVLMFHYSFLDGNADMMLALACRKIMIYHNITPGHFFRAFGQAWLGDTCDAGRAFLPKMNDAFDFVVADSGYNARELAEAGYSLPRVIPVFYNQSYYADGSTENEAFLRRRLAGELNIVFIGRFVPNKRPDNLIRVAAALGRLSARSVRLRFHGKVWDQGYFRSLRRLTEELNVENEISFEINQPPSALRTSLAAADAFVSVSEHEGFMVPLVEAFSAGCPVVALKSSAVTETCGAAGYLVDELDIEQIASSVLAIASDRDLRRDLVRAQSERAFDFSAARTLAKWSALLANILPSPLVNYAHRI